MKTVEPFNIIIAGTGGQGVNTLTTIIWQLCQMSGFYCTGALFKGGAQRMGTVYSEIRVFFETCNDKGMYSTEILSGCANLIIGMEPWETLRYQRYFNSKTMIIANSSIEPFYLERTGLLKLDDPVALLNSLPCTVNCSNYTQESDQIFQNRAMVNYLMGFHVLKKRLLPFTIDSFNTLFLEKVVLADSIIKKIKDYT